MKYSLSPWDIPRAQAIFHRIYLFFSQYRYNQQQKPQLFITPYLLKPSLTPQDYKKQQTCFLPYPESYCTCPLHPNCFFLLVTALLVINQRYHSNEVNDLFQLLISLTTYLFLNQTIPDSILKKALLVRTPTYYY